MKSRRFSYSFPRPMVTADSVVFTIRGQRLEVLLIERAREPFMGRWALPGGFVEIEEPIEVAVARELAEETGLHGIPLRQFYTFGKPGRDPRGRTITVAYLALVDGVKLAPKASDDAAEVGWFSVDELPPLAFDHNDVIAHARGELRALTRSAGVGAALLPREFTLNRLRRLYEIISGASLDPVAFEKKMRLLEVIEPIASRRRVTREGAVPLYRFVPDKIVL